MENSRNRYFLRVSAKICVLINWGKLMVHRNILFLSFNILLIAIYYGPMKELITLSCGNELYSHIILFPLVSGYFLYFKRKSLLAEVNHSYFSGLILILLGMGMYFLAIHHGAKLNRNDYLSLTTFSVVSFWIGGFVFPVKPGSDRDNYLIF